MKKVVRILIITLLINASVLCFTTLLYAFIEYEPKLPEWIRIWAIVSTLFTLLVIALEGFRIRKFLYKSIVEFINK